MSYLEDYDVNQPNIWAKKSCTKWNKNRFSRIVNRKKYRRVAQEFWESQTGRELTEQYRSGKIIDTYPWPYCDPKFANWEEDDSLENYSLISDQSSCVIRYPTSYCAWKIFEATGKWPQKTSRERLDANRWQQFLKEAGYNQIVAAPSDGHYYVGINEDQKYSEFGIVVWFERSQGEKALVSSYVNKKYEKWDVDPAEFVWTLIEK